jgi:AP-1 complex subunit gamma-1
MYKGLTKISILFLTINILKENADTTNITSFFNNKTNMLISDLVFQVAVLKHLKLTMNPINSNKVNSGSRGEVTQVFNKDFFNFF